jgi:hypothetical protein
LNALPHKLSYRVLVHAPSIFIELPQDHDIFIASVLLHVEQRLIVVARECFTWLIHEIVCREYSSFQLLSHVISFEGIFANDMEPALVFGLDFNDAYWRLVFCVPDEGINLVHEA